MAVTVTRVGNPTVFGNKRVTFADVTFDTSYPTGGEPLAKADLGFTLSTDFLIAQPAAGYVFEYNNTTEKLLAYRGKNPADAGGADIPLPEVANAVSLSTVVTRVFAVGT